MNARTTTTKTKTTTPDAAHLGLEDEDENLEVDSRHQLTEIHSTPPAALFAKGGTSAILERIALEARSIVADVGTAAGRSTIRRNAAWVARSKTTLEKIGLEYAREIKAAGVAVDAERRSAREFLDSLRDEVRAPLTALEEAERRRIEEINARLESIVAEGENLEGLTLPALMMRFEWLQDMDMGPDWGNALDLAISHRATAINRLSARVNELTRQAEQETELAKLRAEREAQAARDRAQADADRAARAQAERAAVEARTRALEAERRAVAAEQAAARDRAAITSAEAAVRRAEALVVTKTDDRDLAAKVHREIVADLVDHGITTETAQALVRAIVRGEIPHLRITY